MYETTDTIDGIAMAIGGGLLLLGIVVAGLINELAGAPHLPVEEEGVIVATPVVAPDLRAYIIAVGLVVWGVYGLYKLTTPPSTTEENRSAEPAGE